MDPASGWFRTLLSIVLFASALPAYAERQHGVLTGRVLDSEGHPLVGARVEPSKGLPPGRTDKEGRYRVEGLPPGSYSARATALGYTQVTHAVSVLAGETTEQDFVLSPAEMLLEDVIVSASHAIITDDPVRRSTLDEEEIVNLPKFGDDLFRAVATLPGTSGSDMSARFMVRGGLPTETMINIDGLEIFEPFHLKDFEGVFTILDYNVISGVELMTGGYPAPFGDRLAGVLDMATLDPERNEYRLGISLSNIWGTGMGTFAGGKGRWLASLRRGYLDLLIAMSGDSDDNEDIDVRYGDLFGKLEYDIGARNTLGLQVLAATDSLAVKVEDVDERVDADTGYGNSYLWLRHRALLGERTVLFNTAYLGKVDRDRNILDFGLDDQIALRDQRDTDVHGIKHDGMSSLGERNVLSWGAELRGYDQIYDYRNRVQVYSPLDDPRFHRPGSVRYEDQFSGEQYAVYLEDRIRFARRWTADVGARYDRQTLTEDEQLSPRLNLLWDLDSKGQIRAGWGLFAQSQRPYELNVEDGETEFYDADRSRQIVLGYERLFGEALRFRVDAYERYVDNPRPRYENLNNPFSPYPEAEPDRIRIDAVSSTARGVEVLVGSLAGTRVDWWASYAWAQSMDEVEDGPQERFNDQPHALLFSLNWRPSRKWNFNMVWRYHTGWPTTSVTAYLDDEGQIVPVVGEFYAERLPDYHRLDVRFTRRVQRRKSALLLWVDIQNLYNRSNIRGYTYDGGSFIPRPDGSVRVVPDEETYLGLIPSFGVEWRF